MLIVGGREEEKGEINVRSRDDDKQQAMTVEKFLESVEI
jgi:threonyl-tRNA synthetase